MVTKSVGKLILYMLCLILGGAGAWSISIWGMHLGLLDRPNKRSSHKRIVPKGGGFGILAAFFVSSVALLLPIGFWVPALFLSLLSFWGDRFEIMPKTRLLLQLAASVVFLAAILWENESAIMAYALIPPLAIFVAGTANYYNFMDGINGIAGITGVLGFGLLGWFAFVNGADSRIISQCICLCFACLGFLPFNVPRARVFMGDVGSILLGFVFAGIVVWVSKSLLDFFCASAFIFPFYADELTTLVVRIKDGDRLTKPHRKHLYQIFANEKGVAHWKISVLFGLIQLLVGVSVVVLRQFGLLPILSILGGYFCIFAVLSFYFRKGARWAFENKIPSTFYEIKKTNQL